MSLFEKIQKLPQQLQQELILFYDKNFPIEVRNLLANQIESTLLLCNNESSLDPENPSHLPAILNFLEGIIQGLDQRLSGGQGHEELPFFIKHKLTSALTQLRQDKETDAASLLKRIQTCIQFEMELIQRSETIGGNMSPDILMDNLNYVRKRVEQTGDILKRLSSEQDAFEINLTEKQTLEDHLTTIKGILQPNEETKNFERSVKEGLVQKTAAVDFNLQQMMSLRTQFLEGMKANVKSVGEVQNQVFQEKLFIWKFQQQRGANGLAPLTPVPLDKVQLYLENLSELEWKCRQQLQETERLKQRNPVFNDDQATHLLNDLLVLLTSLLNEAFVVEEQPQQIMKKGNKFTNAPKVSLLVSNLSIQMSCPQVTTSIIREAQARSLSVTENVDIAMPITNGNATLELNPNTRRLTAKFSNLQLREIRRADRRSGSGSSTSESVMEEKLCMYFESMLIVGDLKLRVRTISLPVVVTSHGSQDPTAEATIIWDSAFGALGRIPFQVPHRVPWAELGQVLSAKFAIMTGRPLSEDNLRCLKTKAFSRGNNQQGETISWNEFVKDNLPDRNFSFWHWIYVALKNIERKETHLKDLWREGHLVGFVEREVAASMLSYREPGTFMLRFSDSRAGAITISVVNEDRSVFSIAPMDENDLKQKRLANCIRDLDKLKFLYPDIPKDVAFGKYYSQPDATLSSPDKPYVPLLPSIPDVAVSAGSMTPQHQIQYGGSTPNTNFGGMQQQQQIGMIPSPMPQYSMNSPMGSPYQNQMIPSPSSFNIPNLPIFMDSQTTNTTMAMDTPTLLDEFESVMMGSDMMNDHHDLLQLNLGNNDITRSNSDNNTSQQTTTQAQGVWSSMVQL